ncbi:hypothetical protein OROHE_020599 [Orobanche hederae]
MFLILPFIERLPLSQNSLYHRLSPLHIADGEHSSPARPCPCPRPLQSPECGVPQTRCPARSCSHVAARPCFLSSFRPPPLSDPPPPGVPRPAPCPPAVQHLTRCNSQQQAAPQQPLANSTPRPSPSRSAGDQLRQETVDELQLQLKVPVQQHRSC